MAGGKTTYPERYKKGMPQMVCGIPVLRGEAIYAAF